VELRAAERVARSLGAQEHRILQLDLRAFGGSALTSELEVPKDRIEDQISTSIPVTYVPARNTIFLSLALAYAEVIGASDIFIGVNALDYSGYPDCRPAFIEAFERLANLATKAGVEGTSQIRIRTPLINMSKSEIVQEAAKLHVDLSLTHSCYDPFEDGRPCGRCDSCLLRQRGFREAGLRDPIEALGL
jgi:7-cyano-7-deazaguanine synthase